MKRMLAAMLSVLVLAGCGAPKYEKYRSHFLGTFDTIVDMMLYARSQEEFDAFAAQAKERFQYYNQLFDKYNSYEGVSNIRTINENAGIAPVKVDPAILDLVELGLDWYGKTDGKVNIAFGPVLSIWHEYRERYEGTEEGILPPMEDLEAAAALTDITKVQVDREAGTVYLEEKGMSLDVGAIAKGFATERVGQELYAQGYESMILSGGGNVRIFDPPRDGQRATWGVGIQDPAQDPLQPDQRYLDTIFTNNCSVVTSGNYQRYYLVDGKKMHHIIDPETLMPADRFASVTVVAPTSGEADILSTALFILDEERGRALAEELDLKVMWVYEDGTITLTDSLVPLLKERGGATSLLQK